jgi:hypothetical protein
MDRNDIEKALSRGKRAVRIVAGGWKVDLSLRSGSLSKLVNIVDGSEQRQNQQLDSSMVDNEGFDEMDWAGEESELGIPYYSTYTVGMRLWIVIPLCIPTSALNDPLHICATRRKRVSKTG